MSTGRNRGTDAERISQIAQWYGDPIRDLPRKVVADVQWLLCHIDTLKQQASAAAEPEAKDAGLSPHIELNADEAGRLSRMLDDDSPPGPALRALFKKAEERVCPDCGLTICNGKRHEP